MFHYNCTHYKIVASCKLWRIIQFTRGQIIEICKFFIVNRLICVSIFCHHASGVAVENWAVVTVCKHIIAQESLAGGGHSICIDEPLHNRVIVPALEIVEAGFCIVIVASVSQGIDIADVGAGGNGGAVAVGDAENLAPGVVGIDGFCVELKNTAGIRSDVQQLHYVTLHICDIVVGGKAAASVGGVIHGEGEPTGVIGEDQNRAAVGFLNDPAVLGDVIMYDAIHRFTAADACHIVVIGVGLVALSDGGKLPSPGPSQVRVACTIVPVQRIAAGVVVDGDAVVLGQQVPPVGVAVGVSFGGAVPVFRQQIARRIVGKGVDGGAAGCGAGAGVGVAGLLRELVLLVILVRHQNPVRALALLDLTFIAVLPAIPDGAETPSGE